MDQKEIINKMGGTSKVAEICGITTGAVSQWRKNGIPSYRMDFFRLLRPELFSDALAMADDAVSIAVEESAS
jgi:predicted transcriptional regulator